MKILVLGGQGMLGSRLCDQLKQRHVVHATIRGGAPARASAADHGSGIVVHGGFDATGAGVLQALIDDVQPEAVVNAVGIVKQHAQLVTTEDFVAVNALFPHRLARILAPSRTPLIHVSTDCVFSGTTGFYRPSDQPDPVDVYGLSKLLGEPSADHVTVLRTSMIGLEPKRPGKPSHGLVEWFLAQKQRLNGFSRAIFSGLTVAELSRVIEALIQRRGLPGLWHVAAAPLTKYELLSRLSERLPQRGLVVVPVEGAAIDRSLDASAFNAALPYQPASWDDMLDELADDIRAREGLKS